MSAGSSPDGDGQRSDGLDRADGDSAGNEGWGGNGLGHKVAHDGGSNGSLRKDGADHGSLDDGSLREDSADHRGLDNGSLDNGGLNNGSLDNGAHYGSNRGRSGNSGSDGINETILVQVFTESFEVNGSESFGGLHQVSNKRGQGTSLGAFVHSLEQLRGSAGSGQEGGKDDLNDKVRF